jgi:chromosome segregation ATPase
LHSVALFADPEVQLPPARSAAPPSSVDQVIHPSDLQAVREAAEAAVQRQAQQVDEQARRLSRTAESLNELQSELRTQAETAKALDSSVAGVNGTLSDLDKRVALLGQTAAAKDVDAAAQAAKLKNLGDDLAALQLSTASEAKQMKDGLADIAALREDLKQRQARLDSLTDLLAVIKKDVDANSEEIVEVKQSLKNYQPLPSTPAGDTAEWWDQSLQWKYLPAVAVVLSVVAIGVAATHK